MQTIDHHLVVVGDRIFYRKRGRFRGALLLLRPGIANRAMPPKRRRPFPGSTTIVVVVGGHAVTTTPLELGRLDLGELTARTILNGSTRARETTLQEAFEHGTVGSWDVQLVAAFGRLFRGRSNCSSLELVAAFVKVRKWCCPGESFSASCVASAAALRGAPCDSSAASVSHCVASLLEWLGGPSLRRVLEQSASPETPRAVQQVRAPSPQETATTISVARLNADQLATTQNLAAAFASKNVAGSRYARSEPAFLFSARERRAFESGGCDTDFSQTKQAASYSERKTTRARKVVDEHVDAVIHCVLPGHSGAYHDQSI